VELRSAQSGASLESFIGCLGPVGTRRLSLADIKKITADTNVLIRAAIPDNPAQSARAAAILLDAETVVVTQASLCEFVWVLTRGYKKGAAEIAGALRKLIDAANVIVDRAAVEAGIVIVERGGDFADGAIAFEGRRAGGTVFVTFDEDAAKLIEAAGGEAKLLVSR
jgi:predicted nucleic-acid-binding protein